MALMFASCGGTNNLDNVKKLQEDPDLKGKQFSELSKDASVKLLDGLLDLTSSKSQLQKCISDANTNAQCKTEIEACNTKTFSDLLNSDQRKQAKEAAPILVQQCPNIKVDEFLQFLKEGLEFQEEAVKANCEKVAELKAKQQASLQKNLPLLTALKACGIPLGF